MLFFPLTFLAIDQIRAVFVACNLSVRHLGTTAASFSL